VTSPARPGVSKEAIVAMIVIVAVLACVAIYANVQRWRRDKIERAIIVPAVSPTPARSPVE
jgi:hypothetical protein